MPVHSESTLRNRYTDLVYKRGILQHVMAEVVVPHRKRLVTVTFGVVPYVMIIPTFIDQFS